MGKIHNSDKSNGGATHNLHQYLSQNTKILQKNTNNPSFFVPSPSSTFTPFFHPRSQSSSSSTFLPSSLPSFLPRFTTKTYTPIQYKYNTIHPSLVRGPACACAGTTTLLCMHAVAALPWLRGSVTLWRGVAGWSGGLFLCGVCFKTDR